MKVVTMPPLPWDTAEPEKPCVLTPAPAYVRKLIKDTFSGAIGKADMLYMAKAILQMSDEIFELRERMAAMELALKYRDIVGDSAGKTLDV